VIASFCAVEGCAEAGNLARYEESQMFEHNRHTDAENRWHAELFYSLFKEKVTLAELQEMAMEVKLPLINLRHAKIRRILEQHGAVDQLQELAARCAVVPELLMADCRPTDNVEIAIARRGILCALEDLMREGIIERVGPKFRLTAKGRTMGMKM
jgi:hypothetical protein